MLDVERCVVCAQLQAEWDAANGEHESISVARNRAAGVDGAQFADQDRFRIIEPRYRAIAERRERVKQQIESHVGSAHGRAREARG